MSEMFDRILNGYTKGYFHLLAESWNRIICPYNTVEPRYFEEPREMEKEFEIAGFRNNRGSVKLVTMNHFLIKYSTV